MVCYLNLTETDLNLLDFGLKSHFVFILMQNTTDN